MKSENGTNYLSRWSRMVAVVPMPIRILAAAWLCVSLGFHFGLPGSTANLSPVVSLLALLPMALLSLGLSLFIVWRGSKTLYSTFLSIYSSQKSLSLRRENIHQFIGGMGAINIYTMVFMLAAFSLADMLKNYKVGVALSVAIVAGLAYALIARKPHPKDVKIFLIGALLITIFFGTIMATVAVPPT